MSGKVAIITGTTGALGLAIAKRLIEETPEDVKLTIVATSRTFPSVKNAITDIRTFVETNYAHRKELVEFDYLVFDQCNMVSVLSAAYDIRKRYKHIDYLFLNSSYMQFAKIDYVQAFFDMFKYPLKAFTVGTFKVQGVSRRTDDGMSCMFQANVLAPWYLINEIIPQLSGGGRVVWISTSISMPEYFDPNDLGIDTNEKGYEASKYEMEMMHCAAQKHLYEKHGIESWLIHPGVFVSTSSVFTSLSIFAMVGMYFMFYLCRIMGSVDHCISPWKAASAPVFCALKADRETNDPFLKYGSSVGRLGGEFVSNKALTRRYEDTIYEFVEKKRLEWQQKFKNQIIERDRY
uniref:3beta-hydroxysteroid 3-dehydrogenase n=1 Tax=Blastobotrys adeninivorans TaxID=409370 RepID=A0A060T1E2_BLAAD